MQLSMGRVRQMKNKYNDYAKAYNELAEMLEDLNVSDEIFRKLADVCNIALNINLDEISCND